MDNVRTLESIEKEWKLPVYLESGYPIEHPHIIVRNSGREVFIYPDGDDGSSNTKLIAYNIQPV